MDKCFNRERRGKIGVSLVKHFDKKEGQIILCYYCHRLKHPKRMNIQEKQNQYDKLMKLKRRFL